MDTAENNEANFPPVNLGIAAAGVIIIGILAALFLLLSGNGSPVPVSVSAPRPPSLEDAQSYYGQGKHEEAIPLLEAYLDQPADKAKISVARDLLISSYWQTRNHAKAFALLKEQVKAMPNDSDGVYRLGLLAHEMGKEKTAARYYAQAVAAKPGQLQYHTAYAETLTKLRDYEAARDQWKIVLSLTPWDSAHRATLRDKINQLDTVSR